MRKSIWIHQVKKRNQPVVPSVADDPNWVGLLAIGVGSRGPFQGKFQRQHGDYGPLVFAIVDFDGEGLSLGRPVPMRQCRMLTSIPLLTDILHLAEALVLEGGVADGRHFVNDQDTVLQSCIVGSGTLLTSMFTKVLVKGVFNTNRSAKSCEGGILSMRIDPGLSPLDPAWFV
jgi:hypothetical protein